MLLSKNIDALVLAAATPRERSMERYDIDHVKIDSDGAVYALNGHSLYWAPAAKEDTPAIEDYPNAPQVATDKEWYPLYIKRQAIEKAIKNRPKKTSLSILKDNIRLHADDETISLITTDLDTTDEVKVKNKSESVLYPNIKSIFKHVENLEKDAKIGEETPQTVTLSIAELEKLVKIFKKAAGKDVEFPQVEITVYGPGQPVMVKEVHGDIKGMILPCAG